jgi:hypothetical protein
VSERLSELSASVSLELRTRIQESRDRLQTSSKIMESLRKEPVIVDGTRTILDDIVVALDHAGDLHVGVLKQLNEIYGHVKSSDETDTDAPAPTEPGQLTAALAQGKAPQGSVLHALPRENGGVQASATVRQG